MILSDDNLRAMASGGVVGASWPYDRGSEKDIECHLKNVVGELGRSHVLEVEAEFMHYGSGFASFVDAFCYKRHGKSTVHKDDTDWIDGIAVYLGRLGPVAAFGPQQRTKTYRRGWFGFRRMVGRSFGNLEAENVGEPLAGAWLEEISEIKEKLQRFDFYLASRKELSRELPFEAD